MIIGFIILFVLEMLLGKIAKALDLDVDKAKTLGYIHDIRKNDWAK